VGFPPGKHKDILHRAYICYSTFVVLCHKIMDINSSSQELGLSQAGCHVASCHTVAFRPPAPPPLIVPLSHLLSGRLLHCLSSHHRLLLPAPPPLIAPPPLTTPLLRLLSDWLSRHFLSRHHLPFACTSPSHCTAASHCASLTPLVWLVVASLLITPPPLVRLRLCQTCGRIYPILGHLDKMDRIYPSFPKMRRIYPSYSRFSH
jgi:hypothetical protein